MKLKMGGMITERKPQHLLIFILIPKIFLIRSSFSIDWTIVNALVNVWIHSKNCGKFIGFSEEKILKKDNLEVGRSWKRETGIRAPEE
jgi:hypothetical protein